MAIELQPHLDNTWVTLVDSKRQANMMYLPASEIPKVIELLRSWVQDVESQEIELTQDAKHD